MLDEMMCIVKSSLQNKCVLNLIECIIKWNRNSQIHIVESKL